MEHAAELKRRGALAVVDPGQGLPMFDGDELLSLLDGAGLYVVNDYEWALTQEKTGLDEDGIAERVSALVITRGAEGSIVRRGGKPGVNLDADRSEIPALQAEKVVDPTGCGDAYTAGFIAGLADKTGRVFGLMPHPERFLWKSHHYDPDWSENGDWGWGHQMFKSVYDVIAA